jgi:hypothetical protein
MWLMLFFESSITPGLTGLMISTIPDNYKEIGNSLTQLFYNLIGFLPSPYIYGLVTSFTGGEDSKWGLAVIILWSFFGFLSLFFGQKYFINNNKNEICKEIYLDNLINNDNDDLINISNISNLHSKRKSSYDSNFSEEFNEDENIEYNNTKNENEDNIEYIRGKSTSIIQNIYGGMNHIKT